MDFKALAKRPDLAEEWMDQQEKVNERLMRENQRLRQYIYGEKRERFVASENQPGLPFEDKFSVTASGYVDEAPDDESIGEMPTAKSRPRKLVTIADSVTRIRHRVELPESERVCKDCHRVMVKFSEDLKCVVEYVPARLEVHEYARDQYSCTKCKNTVVAAPVVDSPIEKGLPGPGLLAQVCVSKFADHLPLNRQEVIYSRHGMEVARQTMCDWMGSLETLLFPVFEAHEKTGTNSPMLHADETTILVQCPKVKSGQKRGYLWCLQNLRGEVVFRYHPSRGSAAAAQYLKHFRGWLQVDGYQGYDFLFRAPGGPVEVNCWAHARRKFFDSKGAYPIEADFALKRIQDLYEIERDLKERKMKRKAIEKERKERSAPVLGALHDWMLHKKELIPPGESLAIAISYTLKQWTGLTQYLKEGALGLDNNPIERSIRQVAVGRKNWLFAGSEAGAHRAALFYSLIVTCKNLGINPFEYLKDVIQRVKTHPADRMVDLTPRFWQKAKRAAVNS